MATANRPISTVLHDIVGNVQDIVRSELRLAKIELGEQLGESRSTAALLGVGALTAAFSALFMLLAFAYALSTVVPAWAAALIVATAVGVIAALCFAISIKRLKAMRAPPKTVAILKENAEWARQLTR